MQILWNAMDKTSKAIALQQKLDEKIDGYKELCDHIDLRHKIQLGTFLIARPVRGFPSNAERTSTSWGPRYVQILRVISASLLSGRESACDQAKCN